MFKIIVPVKDRFRHLSMSLAVNYDLLKNHFGEENFEVTIIQQSNNKPWNIGKVVNTGFDIVDCDDEDTFTWFPADYLCNPQAMKEIKDGCCLSFASDRNPKKGYDKEHVSNRLRKLGMIFPMRYDFIDYEDFEVTTDMGLHLAVYKYTGGYSFIAIASSVFRKINGMVHNLDGWGYDDWVITNRIVNNLDWDKILFKKIAAII